MNVTETSSSSDDEEHESEYEEEETYSDIYNEYSLTTEEEILAALAENEKLRDARWLEEAEALAKLNTFSEEYENPEKSGVYRYLVEGELFYFDPFIIPNDASILFLGRRRTGKSFALRWILYTKRKVFPFGVIMTKTKFNGYWTKHVPDESVIGHFSKEVLQNLQDRQEALWKSNPRGEDPRVFVLLDDLAADTDLRHDQDLRTFFYNGRHLKAFTLVTSQWWTALNPGCRDNVDFIFIFGMSNRKEIESIWEEHGGGIPKKIFTFLVSRYSTESSCLVINVQGGTPLERFFQYRAQDPGKFRMGCNSFWKVTREMAEHDKKKMAKYSEPEFVQSF